MSPDIVSRKSARGAGRRFYFTGEPCKHGHVAERYSHNAECVVCNRLRATRKRRPRQRAERAAKDSS